LGGYLVELVVGGLVVGSGWWCIFLEFERNPCGGRFSVGLVIVFRVSKVARSEGDATMGDPQIGRGSGRLTVANGLSRRDLFSKVRTVPDEVKTQGYPQRWIEMNKEGCDGILDPRLVKLEAYGGLGLYVVCWFRGKMETRSSRHWHSPVSPFFMFPSYFWLLGHNL